jgi:membrane-bound metal-dependent hydrolase YbcI (DUF457 family)
MDNLTHTLFAVTLARTPLGRAGRGTLPALVIASNAPDIDIVATARGTASYLAWHRGPTHGPIGVIALGLATAGVVVAARRYIAPRRDGTDASFGRLFAVSTMGVLLHILMDLPTSYGTRFLSPFDWHWFAVDWMPIVDIYLMIALVTGLLMGELSATSRRRLAAIVLVVMAANYGVRAVAHRQALARAPQLFGSLLPRSCDERATESWGLDRWPRPDGSIDGTPGPCLVEMAAMPTFASPFRWRVIAHLSNGYELHDLDLLDAAPAATERFWRQTVRYPDQWTAAAFKAAQTRTAQVFLGFSRFPAARSFTDASGTTTVRWSDIRFVGDLSASDILRPPNIFNVVIRIDAAGRIVDEHLGPFDSRQPPTRSGQGR